MTFNALRSILFIFHFQILLFTYSRIPFHSKPPDLSFWSKFVFRHKNHPDELPYSNFSSSLFGGRTSFRSCSFENNDKIIYLFGGYGCNIASYGYLNDLWSYDFNSNSFEYIFGSSIHNEHPSYVDKGLYSKDSHPGGRSYHQTVCINGTINVLMGYGYDLNSAGRLDEIWSFDVAKKKWKWVVGTGIRNAPLNLGTPLIWGDTTLPGLYAFLAIPFPKNNSIAIFGGCIPSGFDRNILYLFNMNNNLTMYVKGNIAQQNQNLLYSGVNEYHPDNSPEGRTLPCGWRMSDTEFYMSNGCDVWVFSFPYNAWKFVGGDIDGSGDNEYGVIGPYPDSVFPVWKDDVRSVLIDDVAYFFGGVSFGNHDMLTAFDFNNSKWYFVHGSPYIDHFSTFYYEYSLSTEISGRSGFAMNLVKNENDDPTIVIIGGEGHMEYEYIEGFLSEVIYLRPIYQCGGIYEYYDDVCNGKGNCIGFDLCECSIPFTYGNLCEISYCKGVMSNNSKSCNGNGICENEKCLCSNSYNGIECEIPICNGIEGEGRKEGCSSRGRCGIDAKCICELGWEGGSCENRQWLFVLFDIWYLFLAVIVSILFICGVLVIFCTIFLCVIKRQKMFLKRIEELDDINILLEEQKLERDVNKANLKINKNLFVIDFKKEVKILKRIGSLNNVFLVQWKDKKATYTSFRSMENEFLESQSCFEEFEMEISLISSLSHPNIIIWYGGILSGKYIGYLTEFSEIGSIEDFIHNKNVNFPTKIRLLHESICGMSHLHSKSIIHRDLCPLNILVAAKSHVAKIRGFGFSRVLSEGNRTVTKYVGNTFYSCPEIVLGKNYTNKCDVFSFGMLAFCIISEKFVPFSNEECDKATMKMAKDANFRPSLGELKLPKWLENVISKCWSDSSEDRPSFNALDVIFKSKIIIQKEEGDVEILRKELREINERIFKIEEEKKKK